MNLSQKPKRKRQPRLKTRLKEFAKTQKAKWKLALKKPLALSLRQHAGKFVDNLRADDIGFLAAWIGVTILLAQSVEFMSNLGKKIGVAQIDVAKAVMWLHPDVQQVLDRAKSVLPVEEGKKISIVEWIIIIAVAYIIVKHFGAIMQTVGSAAKGIISLGSGLLG